MSEAVRWKSRRIRLGIRDFLFVNSRFVRPGFTLQLQQHLHTVQCLMFMVRIQVLLNDWNTN